MKKTIIIGTRGSQLALRQADMVTEKLLAIDPSLKIEKNISIDVSLLIKAISERLGRAFEQIETRRLLIESEKRYQNLFQNANYGMLLAHAKTKLFKFANPAICEMLGYCEEELQKLCVNDIHPKEELENILSDFAAQLKGEKTLTRDIPCLRKNGDIVFADINATSVVIGKEDYLLGIFRDVTAEKIAKENLEKERTLRIHASRLSLVGELVGSFAHEINTPLTTILLGVESIESEIKLGNKNINKTMQTIQKIKETTKRISNVVYSLKRYSSGGQREPVRPTVIDDIISEALGLCTEKLKLLNIKIIKDLSINSVIECRKTEISQVLINIINNSRDAITQIPDKWIKICSIDNDNFVEIHITDCGQGISKEIIDKLFDPFFTSKSIADGSGLGLSISKDIILSYQGKIFYDEKSKNTKFVIILPKKQA